MPAHSAAGSPRAHAAADILTISFGVAVVQWTAAYLCRMPPAAVPAWVLFGIFVFVQCLGGGMLGKKSRRGYLGGAVTGVATGVINLLVLGSLLGDNAANAAIGAAVFLAGSAVCTLIGYAVGRTARLAETQLDSINWTGAFAKVAVLATFVLIIAGGLVTGMEAGLAVPDWPNTEGALMFLYPLSKMTGGIYFEHAHRLYGALVGLTTVAFAGHVLLHPSGRSIPRMFPGAVRWLAIIAAVLVIAQGVMGGLRVTQVNVGLAIVHGMTAQVFLGLMVALAAFVSTTWNRTESSAESTLAFDRNLSVITLAALFVQLGLGAAYRHLSSAPDPGPGVMHILWTHLSFAVIVLGIIVFTGLRASAKYSAMRPVRASGKALMHIVGAQILLGIAALVVVLIRERGESPSAIEVWFTTAHQGVGAALFAAAALYAVWLRRYPRAA